MKQPTLQPRLLLSFHIEKCPGVCVAERLAGFCEAILDVEAICASNMKCCVSKQIFNDGNNPSELVVPSRETTTVRTSTPRSTPTPRSEVNKNPPGGCTGTCVTGFFALLCDEIDRTAQCPANGRCCITKKVQTSKPPPTSKNCPGFCLPQSMKQLCASPSNILLQSDSCNKGTVCCESRSSGGTSNNEINEKQNTPPRPTTARPLRTPPPRPAPQRPSGGGGPDLTSLLLSAAPTILSAATGSQDAGTTAAALLPVLGAVLGGAGGGGGPSQNRPPQGGGGAGLVGSVLPLLGSLLGGGGGPNRPSPPRNPSNGFFDRPPPPTRPPTTTTTTTTTEKPDDREECPGTCIASYLSFTCFGKSGKSEIPSWQFTIYDGEGTYSTTPHAKLKKKVNSVQYILHYMLEKGGEISIINPVYYIYMWEFLQKRYRLLDSPNVN